MKATSGSHPPKASTRPADAAGDAPGEVGSRPCWSGGTTAGAGVVSIDHEDTVTTLSQSMTEQPHRSEDESTRDRRRGGGKPNVSGEAVSLVITSGIRAVARRLRGQGGEGGVTASTARDRTAEVVALGARLGTAEAAPRARRVFASAARREELDQEHMLRTAGDVAEALAGMKGVMMKLGQMQSYLDDSLPEAWKAALSQLQADAPPMAPELAAAVIEEDLGMPPEALFSAWDGTPIAAASVGQVHRALTQDGRAVAVKVQYPGAAAALTADLDNIGLFIRLSASGQAQDERQQVDLAPL